MDILKSLKRDIDESYLDQKYQETLSKMRNLEREFESAQETAMEIKDNALLWVYTVEYLTVLGTILASGAVLWSVLVKRSLYREVKTTREK